MMNGKVHPMMRMTRQLRERRKWKHVPRIVVQYPGFASSAPPVETITGWEKVRR